MNRSLYAVIGIIAVVVLGLIGFGSMKIARATPTMPDASSPLGSRGAEAQLRVSAVTFTEEEKADLYAAALYLEDQAVIIANVAAALRRGEIVGVPGVAYTGSQLDSIVNEGLGALVRARQTHADLIAIWKLTPAALDAWESNYPQQGRKYCSIDLAACAPAPDFGP